MAEIKQIAISDIGVVDRLRPIDEEHAKAIAISVREIGLMNAITVRWTPAAKTGKYTLVAGGHRLRACQLCGLETINAVVMQIDRIDAQIYEIEENFFRNDLSVIDRSLFAERIREIWEEKSGKISLNGRGRPKKGPSLDLFFHETLSDFVTKRLGISKSAAKRLNRIANNLHPRLRERLRSTKWADNESMLLKLTSMPMDEQAGVFGALEVEPNLDVALKIIRPDKGRQDRKTWNKERFMSAWRLMSEADRQEALEAIGAVMKPLPEGFQIRPERLKGAKPLDPWPVDLPEVLAVPAPGNHSPLWDMLRDPYARLSPRLTYEQVMKAKARYEDEERELERFLKGVQANIEEQEKARQAEFAAERQRAKEKAARALRKKTGASIMLPDREKEMLAGLDGSLQQALGDCGGDRRADLIRACHALDGTRQEAMTSVLYHGCDKDLAREYAEALLADQRAKPRGAGKREVAIPLLVARKGLEKGILPQLWGRIKRKGLAGTLKFYRRVLKELTPERQSFVCDLMDNQVPEDHIILFARKLSSNSGIRMKFKTDLLVGDISPEEIPAWLDKIDFEGLLKPMGRELESV